MAFAGYAAAYFRRQGFAAEDVIIGDKGRGVGIDELDEFFGNEFSDVAADDIVENRLGNAAGIIFIDGIKF